MSAYRLIHLNQGKKVTLHWIKWWTDWANEAMHTGRLERLVRPAPLLSSPGLLPHSASWERLESSAGANKAERYARASEREEERKADDDVTLEKRKMDKQQGREGWGEMLYRGVWWNFVKHLVLHNDCSLLYAPCCPIGCQPPI